MLIKKMFSWLKSRMLKQSWYSEAHHDYFGRMGYYGFKDERVGYWEAEIIHDESVVSVIINSPTEQLPTAEHEQFVKSIVTDSDQVVECIRPLMMKTLNDWLAVGEKAPWQQLFKLSGIEVPIDANKNNNWNISFECLVDKTGHEFTCYFERGKPSYVSVEG